MKNVGFEELSAVCPVAPADPAKLLSVYQKYSQKLLGPPIRVRAEIAAAVIA
jgi:hypothetical protein